MASVLPREGPTAGESQLGHTTLEKDRDWPVLRGVAGLCS